MSTAAHMSRMSLPIFVSCTSALSDTGILGPVLAPTVGAGVPETCAVRAGILPVGLALPPDASSSCRGQ